MSSRSTSGTRRGRRCGAGRREAGKKGNCSIVETILWNTAMNEASLLAAVLANPDDDPARTLA
jgi:hypothetical protein